MKDAKERSKQPAAAKGSPATASSLRPTDVRNVEVPVVAVVAA